MSQILEKVVYMLELLQEPVTDVEKQLKIELLETSNIIRTLSEDKSTQTVPREKNNLVSIIKIIYYCKSLF